MGNKEYLIYSNKTLLYKITSPNTSIIGVVYYIFFYLYNIYIYFYTLFISLFIYIVYLNMQYTLYKQNSKIKIQLN